METEEEAGMELLVEEEEVGSNDHGGGQEATCTH